jgi:formylglycine-generating enzyme required for sulfatase activity
MGDIRYDWQLEGTDHVIELVHVEGTGDRVFPFGDEAETRAVRLSPFFLATVPVTQALWVHIMGVGSNPSHHIGDRLPVDKVSWDDITQPEGFLHRIAASPVLPALLSQIPHDRAFRFRLPSETEWEYSARGGTHWPDRFLFSGSSSIDSVAWYHENSSNHTHGVGQKAPNQLGLYDMSGNVWEWCQDCFTRDIHEIPADGSAFVGPSVERVLRGGCFHNGANHSTAIKRYEIARDYRDECIGFRLVFGVS